MADTSSFFGGPLDLGPCNAYWDEITGGANMFLGGFDNLVMRIGHEAVDLVTAQTGTGAADDVITRSYLEFEFGMAQATLERLNAIMPGFELVTATGGSIVGFTFGGSVGSRGSQRAKQMRLIRVFDEIESTDPKDEIIVFKAIPNIAAELNYDAASQRFFGTMFKAQRDPTKLSAEGRQLFLGGGLFE